MYSVVEEVVLDLLHDDVISETLDAPKAKFLGTNAPIDRHSKNVLAKSPFSAQIATFVQVKIEKAAVDPDTVFAKRQRCNLCQSRTLMAILWKNHQDDRS